MGSLWSSMAPSDPVVVALGWIGSAAAFFLFLSPIKTFSQIIKTGDVKGFDYTPYVVTMTNCALWTTYGLITPGRLQPTVTNAGGGALELCYCLVFLRHAAAGPRAACLRALVLAATFIVVVDVASILFASKLRVPTLPGDSPAGTVIATVAAVFNVMMYAAPLNVARAVVRTESVEFMPLGLTLGTTFCSVAWTAYSFVVGDVAILVPNLLGDVLSVLQVLLYCRYASSTAKPEQPADDDSLAVGLLQ